MNGKITSSRFVPCRGAIKREKCHEQSNILRSFVAMDDGAFRIPALACHVRSDGSTFTCFCYHPPTTAESRQVQQRHKQVDGPCKRARGVRTTEDDAVAKQATTWLGYDCAPAPTGTDPQWGQGEKMIFCRQKKRCAGLVLREKDWGEKFMAKKPRPVEAGLDAE